MSSTTLSPARTFADLGVPSSIVDALAARGITAPFDIQAASITDTLAGHDVCGRAPTGSGKTLVLWLAPFLLVLFGGFALYRVVRHRTSLPINEAVREGDSE